VATTAPECSIGRCWGTSLLALPTAATLGALGIVYGDIGTSPLFPKLAVSERQRSRLARHPPIDVARAPKRSRHDPAQKCRRKLSLVLGLI
jgi:hypothetical protein